jgi:hypothetical protein
MFVSPMPQWRTHIACRGPFWSPSLPLPRTDVCQAQQMSLARRARSRHEREQAQGLGLAGDLGARPASSSPASGRPHHRIHIGTRVLYEAPISESGRGPAPQGPTSPSRRVGSVSAIRERPLNSRKERQSCLLPASTESLHLVVVALEVSYMCLPEEVHLFGCPGLAVSPPSWIEQALGLKRWTIESHPSC